MVIGYVKPTHTQKETHKETRGHSSRVHGNGWIEHLVKLANCIEEWLRPLGRRVDSYHTQVNTHMHRVTHIQKSCKCTNTDTRTNTRTDTYTKTTHIYRHTQRHAHRQHTDTHTDTHKHRKKHMDTHPHVVCMAMDGRVGSN